MNNKERQPGFIEKSGVIARNGGIIAGIIGFLASWELLAGGVIVAGGGEILRRVGKGKNGQSGS